MKGQWEKQPKARVRKEGVSSLFCFQRFCSLPHSLLPRHELFSNLGSSELLRGLIRTHTSLDSHLSFWHPTPGERWVTVALKQDRSHRTLMLLIQDDTWRTTDVNDSRIKPEPQMQEQEHSLSFCNSAKMVFESLSTWQGGGNVITVHSGFNLTFFCVPPVLAC